MLDGEPDGTRTRIRRGLQSRACPFRLPAHGPLPTNRTSLCRRIRTVPSTRWLAGEGFGKHQAMLTLLLIIVVLVLLFGGYGYSRRP